MWKWIGGGCLLIVVLMCVLVYGSYRTMSKIAESGPAASVTMGAKPDRVFASLASADSMSTWRAPGFASRTNRRGMLVRGDTLFEGIADTGRARMVWVVDTVVPPQLLAIRGVTIADGR